MRAGIFVVLVGVVGLATAVLIGKVGRTRVAAAAPSSTNTTETTDELELKVASLERQLVSLREIAGRPAPPVSPTAAKQDERQASEPEDPVALQQAVATRDQAQMELLRTRFEQEPRDAKWSDQATGKLEDVYKGELFKGMEVARADCRSSLCRVDVRIASPETGHVALRLLGLKAPWSAPNFVSINTETGQGIFYLARAGHNLPMVPQSP